MKYLFIELQIQDGERRHTHRTLHTTNCKNINFAAQRYAATYWGDSSRDFGGNAWYAHGGEIAIECTDVQELTKPEYDFLQGLFYGIKPNVSIPNDELQNFSQQEIDEFKENWGQTESEVCSALCLDEEEAGAFLVNDYFYYDDKWYEKFSSMYSEREIVIAEYLKNLS